MSQLARQNFAEFDPTTLQFVEQAFQTLFDHWSQLRVGSDLPQAKSLSPRALAPHLHNMVIQEVHSPLEVRYRLVGTSVVSRMGVDPTGKNLLDYVADQMHQAASLLFQFVSSHPCGALTSHLNIAGNGRAMDILSLYLPVAVAPGEVPRVVSIHAQEEIVNYLPPSGQVKIGSALNGHAWIDLGFGQPKISAAAVT